ncbi:family 16 glycosylhydrolase [Paucihalobacter sp.]|uniref:family 16 glycosylhydrolase n=1 Tax=Paucihalobacter sp. TaxID=2850405 RepID=UPI002FDFA52C
MIRSSLKIIFIYLLSCSLNAQTVEDDFEGNGSITTWYGDDCAIDISYPNPFQESINNSNTVLRYNDVGGPYANVRFDVLANFDLSVNRTFSFKIFVPSESITGNQPNEVALKLQNRFLGAPWSTQTEIKKAIVLDEWQVVTFDFANDNYINLDPNSGNPVNRDDLNRVLIQVNGENNNDLVTAYIDDFLYDGTIDAPGIPNFDYLVWSDEFNGSGAIDGSKWFHQTLLPNGVSWYNNEIQHYTNRLTNTFESDGNLNLVAKKETFTDQGVTKEYTSARLNSKFAFTYGKVEVRAKLPSGVGTWPAIWTLGKNITEPGGYWTDDFGTTPWPACGEIDIMEHWGSDQNFVQSAMHTPSSHSGTINKGGQIVPTASTEFHVYTLVWTEEQMIFSVDDNVHYIYNPEVKNADTWPFDDEQYLLLNFAIQPSIDPNFTEDAMEIDYVRIYQETPLSIDNQVANDVTIYPIPARDSVNIRIDNQLIGTNLKVYSMLGQKLVDTSLDSIDFNLNISAFTKGIYILSIENETHTIVKKIIKN